MRHKRALLAGLILTGTVLASATMVDAASPWEQRDVAGQGMGGSTVAEGGAKILRTSNGLTASVSMPTPAPGSYAYPVGPTASGVGHPEAFTAWTFVFFNPEACIDGCDGTDLRTNLDVVAGGFNVGGHLAGGPNLTLTGHVNPDSTVFGGPNAESLGQALGVGFDIADAEIHLAVAPHGALAPELLPAAISTPAGDPNFWWVATFK